MSKWSMIGESGAREKQSKTWEKTKRVRNRKIRNLKNNNHKNDLVGKENKREEGKIQVLTKQRQKTF